MMKQVCVGERKKVGPFYLPREINGDFELTRLLLHFRPTLYL